MVIRLIIKEDANPNTGLFVALHLPQRLKTFG